MDVKKSKQENQEKQCENCAYYARSFKEEPCNKCKNENKWLAQCEW